MLNLCEGGLGPATSLKETPIQLLSCEICKIFRTPIFTEHLRWLLLKTSFWNFYFVPHSFKTCSKWIFVFDSVDFTLFFLLFGLPYSSQFYLLTSSLLIPYIDVLIGRDYHYHLECNYLKNERHFTPFYCNFGIYIKFVTLSKKKKKTLQFKYFWNY